MAKVHIGSISTGTLRSEDLAQAFSDELERLNGGPNSLTLAVTRWSDEEDTFALNEDIQTLDDWTERGSHFIDELADALNEYAPPHTYFGALEGDGADFGFWPTGEPFESTCHVETVWTGRNGDGEFIDLDCKLWITVSDHGNITVSQVGPTEEIWSAV